MVEHFEQGLRYDHEGEQGYALYLPFIHGGKLLSSDYAFCERARRVDAVILLDCGVKCVHWGMQGWGFDNVIQ